MRSTITFACGVAVGGALESTIALASAANRHGHHALVIVAAGDPYVVRRRRTAATVHLARAARRLSTEAGDAVWWMHDRFPRRSTATVEGVRVVSANDVPSAVRALHVRGTPLVVNSMRTLDLDRVLRLAAGHGRVVWYLRETAALPAVARFGTRVDALVANSRPLAREATVASGGVPCHFVPSVVDVTGLSAPSRRDALLVVNVHPTHGLDAVVALAERQPGRTVVLQESWSTPPAEWAAVEDRTHGFANVELRRRAPRTTLYRDAYALLAMHEEAAVGLSRPRVALEAQSLGVPMVCSAAEGLVAVAASPELVVRSSDPAALDATLAVLDSRYAEFCAAARAFATAELVTPDLVWEEFERLCLR